MTALAFNLRHTDTHVQYALCDCCSAGVANDDWTHLDAQPEMADENHARIGGTLELLGWLTPLSPYDPGGYWTCEICWETCIGSGQVWEGERRRG